MAGITTIGVLGYESCSEQDTITRRGFVAGTVATGAAVAAPASAQAAARKPKRTTGFSHRVDVVVVGAGFAGLTAARNIARRVRRLCRRLPGRRWSH